MKKPRVDIGRDPPERAGNLCAIFTNGETADDISREAVHSEARRPELEALVKMDGLDLANVETIRNAWRFHDTNPCAVSTVAVRDMEPRSPEELP